MREVLLRTDLWSDQVIVLRAVQTLTMLDVQHNCDLVWNLGGYTPAGNGIETDAAETHTETQEAAQEQGCPSSPVRSDLETGLPIRN
jgi:hypothetical protein